MIDKLHYISQQSENGTHLTAIRQALEAGCKWIQLRVKKQPANVILEYAIEANRLCNRYGAKLIVNDHPEIALKAGAYGVHLGLEDMPVSRARDIVGNEMIIGGTANTIEHVEQRISEGADYIGLGPYRFTTTKQKLSPILGWDGINAIMRKLGAAHIPIIGIGGILTEDIKLIMETGVHGVAVSGAITYAANRAEVVKQMYHQLNAPFLNPILKA
ncbi:MAG: thiamine phosphate synthase [Mucilaginibacter sp.]